MLIFSIIIAQVYKNMALSGEQRNLLRQLIINEHFEDLDLTEQHLLDSFLQFIHELPVQPLSLQILQILIMGYGLPIIICARSFYERVAREPLFVSQNKQSLLKLASLTIQWTQQQPIQYIEFMFQFGRPLENPKPIRKTATDVLLVKLVQEIELKNKQLTSCTDPVQALKLLTVYRSRVGRIKSKDSYDFDLLMKNCLERVILSEQQMKALEFNQNIENIEMNQNRQTSFLDNSIADLNNFLSDHQSKKVGNQSTISLSQQEGNFSKLSQEQTFSKRALINQPSQIHSVKLTPTKIVEKQVVKPLCCRVFFFSQQVIATNQDESLAFLYAPYPFKKEKESHIRRIICSFLNANGGILFVGFAKENEKWFAVGSASLKYDMAAIKKSFRQICEAIEPDILTHKMYEIELIPVCKWEKLDTEGFIIKVIVKYGTRDEIYSYKQNHTDRFPFRQGEEIIEKQGRELMDELNKRICNPLPIPPPTHSSPCHKPDPLFLSQFRQSTISNRSHQTPLVNPRQSSQNLKINGRYQSYNFQKGSSTSFSLQNKHPSPKIKPFIIQEDHCEKVSNIAESSNQGKWSYFYCCSLTENQINPIFKKKGLEGKVKVESLEAPGIIVKASDQDYAKEVRKICTKLEEKYKDRGIKFHELSLEIEVQQVDRALKVARNLRIEGIGVKQSVVKFRFFKDSLRAFNQFVKQGIRCKFKLINV